MHAWYTYSRDQVDTVDYGLRPASTMTARAVGLFLLLARDASAWGSCRKFSEIYASGQEMCEVLWADAFEYTADESAAYTMWFFDQVNPNNAVAASLGKIENPDTCELQYFRMPRRGSNLATSRFA